MEYNSSEVLTFVSAWSLVIAPFPFVDWHKMVRFPKKVPKISSCLFKAVHDRLKTAS